MNGLALERGVGGRGDGKMKTGRDGDFFQVFICQIMVKCINQKQNGPLLAQTSAEFFDTRSLHLSQAQSPLGGSRNGR